MVWLLVDRHNPDTPADTFEQLARVADEIARRGDRGRWAVRWMSDKRKDGEQ